MIIPFLHKKVSESEQIPDRFNEGLKRFKESRKYGQIIANGLGGQYADPD